MIKPFFFFMSFLPVLLIFKALDQYFFCPSFSIQSTERFHGDSMYNPYAEFKLRDWTKSNFHAHTNAWSGITNGKGKASDIFDAYDSLGYSIHSVSEYHKINPYGDTSNQYISAYEHGYNLKKTHQLVLGDKDVVWKDYLFPQTLANKQHILNLLSANPENVVIINHPKIRSGYETNDMKSLYNYDCLEVLNPAAQSFSHWDTALSNGKKIFIVGNDDVHNVFKRNSIGRFCTLIYSPGRNRKEVLRSLKTGKSIAMWIPDSTGQTFQEKIVKLKNADPGIENFLIVHDSLQINFSRPVLNLSIIGQGGQIVYTASSTDHVSYLISQQDTYLRVSYTTNDSIQYFLNPVFRNSGEMGNRISVIKDNLTMNLGGFFPGLFIFIAYFGMYWLVIIKKHWYKKQFFEST